MTLQSIGSSGMALEDLSEETAFSDDDDGGPSTKKSRLN